MGSSKQCRCPLCLPRSGTQCSPFLYPRPWGMCTSAREGIKPRPPELVPTFPGGPSSSGPCPWSVGPAGEEETGLAGVSPHLLSPGPGYILSKPGPAGPGKQALHPPPTILPAPRIRSLSPSSSLRPSCCSFCHNIPQDPSQADPSAPNSSGLHSLPSLCPCTQGPASTTARQS